MVAIGPIAAAGCERAPARQRLSTFLGRNAARRGGGLLNYGSAARTEVIVRANRAPTCFS
jgi:hypothetical protein